MNWDEYADGWDENPAVMAYADAAYSSLLRMEQAGLVQIENSRVLDFGCGTGLLSRKLSSRAARVVALDTSDQMIEILKTKIGNLGLTNLDLITKPLEEAISSEAIHFDSPFDLITCSSVCAFLEEYPATVRTLSRLLRHGGAFVQWDWELDPEDEEPYGLTRDEIDTALADAGLKNRVVEVAFEIEFEGELMRPLIGLGVR